MVNSVLASVRFCNEILIFEIMPFAWNVTVKGSQNVQILKTPLKKIRLFVIWCMQAGVFVIYAPFLPLFVLTLVIVNPLLVKKKIVYHMDVQYFVMFSWKCQMVHWFHALLLLYAMNMGLWFFYPYLGINTYWRFLLDLKHLELSRYLLHPLHFHLSYYQNHFQPHQ